MNKSALAFITIILLSINTLQAEGATAAIERRAAIDTGSGSTKITIADVDTTDGKIYAIVY